MSSATLTVEPLLQTKITGRALRLIGISFPAVALAQIICLYGFSAMGRTLTGLLVAALMIGGGHILAQRANSQSWWSGTMLMGTGYAVGYFFTQAAAYVGWLPSVGSEYPCWALSLCLALSAVWHGSRNSLLRWLSLPFAVFISGQSLLYALASTQTLTVAGLTFNLAAVASVAGMLWWSGLSALYKHLETGVGNGEPRAVKLLYRVAHEGLFVLAALNALALPKFCGSLDFAPVWWSIEMPVLLAICWRSGNFVKHALVMAVWSLSAVLAVTGHFDLSPAMRMTVPAAGMLMAMFYRLLKSSSPHWQKVVGYSVFLYASVLVSLAVPILFAAHDALRLWLLVSSAVILGMALVLRDRVLQYAGSAVAVGALVLHAINWQLWNYVDVSMVVGGCYAFSFLYGRIQVKGGWSKSALCAAPGSFTLNSREALVWEVAAAAAGYASLIAGSFFLFANPYNTVAWGIEAFALIAFGFITNRKWHRASGLLAMAIASAKLSIFDLSGVGTILRTLYSFGAIGVCLIASGLFYLREFSKKSKS